MSTLHEKLGSLILCEHDIRMKSRPAVFLVFMLVKTLAGCLITASTPQAFWKHMMVCPPVTNEMLYKYIEAMGRYTVGIRMKCTTTVSLES
jgi:hypothetical protein